MHHFSRPYIRCLFSTHLSQRPGSGGLIEARSIRMGAKQTQQLERQTLHTRILESLPPALAHFNGLQRDDIMEYLAANPHIKSFVILDDRISASNSILAKHFVHTVSKEGLTDEKAKDALNILNNLTWNNNTSTKLYGIQENQYDNSIS